jgi:hypothetical protein
VDEPRRNDAFDRELQRTLAAGGGAAGPHLDAELAAAWMEQRLGGSAARSIEAHLADCADCQMMMATLARISPETETSAAGDGVAWWRRLRAGWLVPATVATAAALVIWVALPQQQRSASTVPAQTLDDRASTDQLAKSEAAAPAAPQQSAAAPSAAAPTVAPPSAVRPEADASAGSRRFAPEAEQKTANLEAAPPPPAAAAPAPPRPAAPELERRNRADAATPAPAESLRETITVQGETPVADAQAKAAGGVVGRSTAAPPERQEAAPAQARFAADAVGRAAALRAAGTLDITAPDGARWRRTGSAIEFAPRNDAPFTAVALPVPATAISAGTSPGGTVCWLVGPGGLVLVAVDGVRFVRVGAPAALDLVAVTATDARTATVTTFTARRFRTTDAGATWTALP